MFTIQARNVHDAIPLATVLMRQHGVRRDSRNGPVLKLPGPCTTMYERPWERLAFWPQRDINTAFLVYESLWMLAGRRDLKPMLKYVKSFSNYSDDGETLHGAYGWRWHGHFDGRDQLHAIIETLKRNHDDRRCVLQMWDCDADLAFNSKDIPCNLMATFQIEAGALHMTVFNRSNDIVWGAYFANAFHFSMLQDYMANAIGVECGIYHQVSVNFHAYLETFKQFESIPTVVSAAVNPYRDEIWATRISGDKTGVDRAIHNLLQYADDEKLHDITGWKYEWQDRMAIVLRAHETFRRRGPVVALQDIERTISQHVSHNDLVSSMRNWLETRVARGNSLET